MPGIENIKNIFFIKFLLKYFNQIVGFRKKIGEKQSLYFKILISEVYLIFLSFFSVLAVEMINNGNFNVVLSLSVNNVRFIFAFILFFAINQFLFLSTFRLSIPLFFTFPISVIISFINYSKLFYRGEPFVINDLYLAKELFKIMNKYNFVVIKEVYFAIVIFIVLLTLLLFIGRIGLKKRVRFLFFAPSLLIFLFFLNFFVISDASFLNKVYQKDLFNAEAEYKSNGFLIFFLGRAKLAQIKAPDSYSQNNVKKYAAELNYSEDIDYSQVDDSSKPNVIVIMNEAFWNPDYMTGVKLNIDPLEKIRQDKDITIGSLISPVMGGATSQVEYEFLTGKSTYFFPAGSIVYTQYILNKQWSLGWYFKAMDYNSVFIHPYEKDFYNRDKVISLLGFDEKYFMHNMRNTETRRGIISDLSVAKEIITCYEENNGKPFFSFAITMQNHGGWPVCNYYPKSVEVGLEYGDTSLKTSLEEYLEGVKDGCEAYKYLVDYFEKVDKPTYIVMFGDHSPSIALDARMFKDNKISDDDRKNIYTTPIFIWSNVKKEVDVKNF
ncbi:MAG TPA: sulfatase-like hydrolase/transferase, partial [Spirochaetota bacterium]|nr:sulfatase-like hydrolase/transferase [Spirochaetota bacterium]